MGDEGSDFLSAALESGACMALQQLKLAGKEPKFSVILMVILLIIILVIVIMLTITGVCLPWCRRWQTIALN